MNFGMIKAIKIGIATDWTKSSKTRKFVNIFKGTTIGAASATKEFDKKCIVLKTKWVDCRKKQIFRGFFPQKANLSEWKKF